MTPPFTSASATLQAAMDFATRGWRVHPLFALTELGVCTCPKGQACGSPGKHPRLNAWQKAATTDEEVIAGWWEQWPKSNVAVVMGPTSGIIDLEADNEEAEQFLLELFKGYELNTPTFKSSRGTHRLFKYTGDLPNSDKGHWRLKSDLELDFKIGNGNLGTYCVFPPSRHFSGAVYQWVLHPDDYPLLDIPPEVIARLHAFATEGDLKPSESQRRPQEHWDKILDGVSEGGRNEAAASLAGKIISQMATPEDQSAQSFQLSVFKSLKKQDVPPLEDVELEQIWKSVLKRHLNGIKASSRLDQLRETLKLPDLKEVVAKRDVEPRYEFIFDDGQVVVLGTGKVVGSTKEVRRKVMEARQVEVPYFKNGWPQVEAAIYLSARRVSTGDRHAHREAVSAFLHSRQHRSFQDCEPESGEWYWRFMSANLRCSHGESGCVWLPKKRQWIVVPDSLASFLHDRGKALSHSELLIVLDDLGFKEVRPRCKDPDSEKTVQPRWKISKVGDFCEGD